MLHFWERGLCGVVWQKKNLFIRENLFLAKSHQSPYEFKSFVVFAVAGILGQTQLKTLFGLENCQELVPGVLNLWWTLEGDGNTLDMALEGVLPSPQDQYLSFGFSPPGSINSRMVGSNVIVGGTVGIEPFAMKYYLDRKMPCNYEAASGVCPVSVFNDDGSTQVELQDFVTEGSAVAFHVKVPLNSPDAGWWPVNGSQPAIYAIGPVQGSSSVEKPEVLIHRLHTPSFENVVVDFSSSMNSCTPILKQEAVIADPPAEPEVPTVPDVEESPADSQPPPEPESAVDIVSSPEMDASTSTSGSSSILLAALAAPAVVGFLYL